MCPDGKARVCVFDQRQASVRSVAPVQGLVVQGEGSLFPTPGPHFRELLGPNCQNCRFPHVWEKQLTLYEVGGGGGCDLCHEKAASACVTLCGGQAATASGQTRSQEVTWTDR